MTIAGHDLVLAVAALTLPIVALMPRNAPPTDRPTRMSTREESRHDGNNTPNRS